MLHTYALPAGRSATGPSPTVRYRLSHRELTALQRDNRARHARMATSWQRCSAARDLLAIATERLTCSQHFLATSREMSGRDAEEHQP
jgi:hypothetical protein